MQLFNLIGNIQLTGLNSVQSGLNNIGSRLTSVGGKIAQFGGALTAGISVPIAGLALAGIKYNSTMENLTTNFEVMLGSADEAGKMVQKLKEMGAATPFDATQLASYTETLLAFGYTGNEVLPIMSRLGDISLGNNEKMSSLTRTMGQINSLGRLQGGDLNQLIGQGWNPLNEITKKTGESMEEVRKRMSQGKVTYKEVEQALIDATSKGGTFYQGMAKGSQTLEGRISTLKDNFNSFLGEATKPLFDFLANTAVPALIKLTEKLSNLSPKTKMLITIFAALAAIIPVIITAIGGLIVGIGSVITAVGAISGVLTVISGALAGISAPVLAVIGVIVSLIAIFTTLMIKSESFRTKIFTVFESVKTIITNVSNVIKQAFLNIDFSGVIEAFNKIKEHSGGIIKTFTMVVNVLKIILNALIMHFKTVGIVIGVTIAAVTGIVVGLVNGLIGGFSGLIEIIAGVILIVEGLVSVIMGLVTGDMSMVKEGFIAMWDGIKTVFIGAFNFIVGLVKGFIDGIVGFFTSLYNTLVGNSIIPDMVNGIIRWIAQLPGKVLSLIASFISGIISKFNNLKSKVISVVSGFMNSIKTKFNQMKSVVGSVISALVNKAISLFNSFKSKVGSVISAIKNIIQSRFNAAKSIAIGIISSLVSSAVSRFQSIKSKISSVINSVKSTISNGFNAAKSMAVRIIQSLASSVSSKFNMIKSAIQGVANKFSTITSAVQRVINKIKQIKFPSIPKGLPGFAGGVRNFGGGLAMVGERGPELIYLPKGSNVYSNKDTRTMLNSMGSVGKSVIPNITGGNENFIMNGNITIDASKISDITDVINIFKNLKSEQIARGGAY